MADFVLDASVAISWCFPGDPTENTSYSRRILALLRIRNAIVPEVWPFEVANAIFIASTKRNRITHTQIAEFIQRLTALPIRMDSRDLWSNLEIESRAPRWNLTAYDAAYLDLAKRLAIPLPTGDDNLRKSALAESIEVL